MEISQKKDRKSPISTPTFQISTPHLGHIPFVQPFGSNIGDAMKIAMEMSRKVQERNALVVENQI